MSNYIKTAIICFLIGIGFGGIIYSLSLVANGADTQTIGQIGSVVLFSGCIGLLSMIFKLEKPSFTWRLIIHFLAVFSLFLLMYKLNDFSENLLSLAFLGQFLLIYVLVWAVVVYIGRQKVAKINEKLRERKESLDKPH